MTGAVASAIARARSGLDWSYPCLIWVFDFVRDATGTDYAAPWRRDAWDEATAKAVLARVAAGGRGDTAVEKALDRLAREQGFEEVDGPRQGAVMIGVYDAENGVGVPAIFDGEDRWIISNDGKGVTVTGIAPKRMWEIVREAA
ncbi:MAG: hypothetical protein JWQ89_2247 [Devosia sp.]|uniref:hypothetical protein n=1 Tax=Devosia sp. TaxID=1871048 RepID=UPI00262E84DA|nr:hypothetical protein [Devosia sp.]MDB5540520.1 hypothetical protein [Devosia sp.]